MTEIRDPDKSRDARTTAVNPLAASPKRTADDPENGRQWARLNAKEAVAILSWLAVAVAGLFFFFFEDPPFQQFGASAWGIGTIMFVYYRRALAERKGYSRSLGYLALAPPYIGLVFLVWFPAREKKRDYEARRAEQLGRRWPGPTYK